MKTAILYFFFLLFIIIILSYLYIGIYRPNKSKVSAAIIMTRQQFKFVTDCSRMTIMMTSSGRQNNNNSSFNRLFAALTLLAPAISLLLMQSADGMMMMRRRRRTRTVGFPYYSRHVVTIKGSTLPTCTTTTWLHGVHNDGDNINDDDRLLFQDEEDEDAFRDIYLRKNNNESSDRGIAGHLSFGKELSDRRKRLENDRRRLTETYYNNNVVIPSANSSSSSANLFKRNSAADVVVVKSTPSTTNTKSSIFQQNIKDGQGKVPSPPSDNQNEDNIFMILGLSLTAQLSQQTAVLQDLYLDYHHHHHQRQQQSRQQSLIVMYSVLTIILASSAFLSSAPPHHLMH